MLCLKKETSDQPSKAAVARYFFSSVYVIGKTCFDEWFLFDIIIGVYKNLSLSANFCNCQIAAFFKRNVLKEFSTLCQLSSQ